MARPDAFLADLARSLYNLAIDLWELGRREGGLAAAEETVAANRRLAALRLDAFLPDLAIDLGALGRDEEGLAAVEEADALRATVNSTWPSTPSGTCRGSGSQCLGFVRQRQSRPRAPAHRACREHWPSRAPGGRSRTRARSRRLVMTTMPHFPRTGTLSWLKRCASWQISTAPLANTGRLRSALAGLQVSCTASGWLTHPPDIAFSCRSCTNWSPMPSTPPTLRPRKSTMLTALVTASADRHLKRDWLPVRASA